MADPDYVIFKIGVAVHDRRALRRAALKQAVSEGMTGHEWRALRRAHGFGLGADVIMLLDPGSRPDAGIELDFSEVHEDY